MANLLIYNNMPLQIYETMLQCLRFDKKESRSKNDKLATIRVIFERFIDNCKKNYTPEQMTIDEQLVTFRCGCGFEMFIKA